MGEYYDWVNVDKMEYICPVDFDYGSKHTESSIKGNEFLYALYDLLSSDWQGDHVFWMGDEKSIPADTENITLYTLYQQSAQINYHGDAFETVLELYKNVSGLYKAAEKEVREEIAFYLEDLNDGIDPGINKYGINRNDPFAGMFTRSGQDFRYILNHDRKECYSLDHTKVLDNNTELEFTDPLPFLMAYGRVSETGAWLGNLIGVANEVPIGYQLLDEIHINR